MKANFLKCYFLAILSAISFESVAQVEVKVITKTIEQSFDYTMDNDILIRGDKSLITVHGWTRNEVKVKLKLIAKAVNENVAKRELEFQKYILEKKKGTITAANFYQIPSKYKELQSILLAEYEIWVPAFSKIAIINSYGNVYLSKMRGKQTINNKFGNIVIDDVSGVNNFECYFGDFIARNLDGKNMLKFNKTKTTIEGLSGLITIESKLGDITIDNLNGMLAVDIKASKSDINLELEVAWKDVNINLKSEFGEIDIPNQFTEAAVKRGNVAIWSSRGSSQSKITAETSFGTISLGLR